MSEIGVITEQGDLGLGFDPLNAKDNQVYTEATNKQQDQNKNNSSENK